MVSAFEQKQAEEEMFSADVEQKDERSSQFNHAPKYKKTHNSPL